MKALLSVKIDQQQLILHNDFDVPPTIVSGLVTLELTSKINPSKLSVFFVGNETLFIPAFDISNNIPICKVKQKLWKKGQGDLQPNLSGNRDENSIFPGIHSWPFCIEVPNDLNFPSLSVEYGNISFQCMAILEMNSTTKLIKANQEIKVIHQLWSPSNFGSTSTVNGSTFLNEFEYNITHLPIISIQDTKNMKTTLTLSTKEKDIQRITRLSSHITEKQIYKLDNAADIDTCWSETFCLSKPVKYKIAKNITSNKRIFENNGEISDLNENSTSNNKKDKIKTDSMILLVSAKIEPNVDASTNHFEVQHFLNFDIEFETDSIHPNQIAKNKFYSIFKFSHNASRDQLIHNPSTLLTSDSSDDEITKNYNNRSSKSKPFDDCNIAQQKDIRYKLQKVSISIPIVIVGKIENF